MNEINYQSLLEQLPALQIIIDVNLKIVTASKLFLQTVNLKSEKITGEHISFIYQQTANDVNECKRIETSLKLVLQNKTPDKIFVLKNKSSVPESGTNTIENKLWQITHTPIFNEVNEVQYLLQTIDEAVIDESIVSKLLAEKKNLFQIQENNERHYKMMMNSPFAFAIIMGHDLVVTAANDLMKTFWGKGENIEGKSLLEILPEIKDQPFPEMLRTVLKTGNAFHENETLAKLSYNGVLHDKYFNIAFQPYVEADQKITGITITAYEVTEIVSARKTIQENELFNRSIIESSPDCIKIIDENGKIEFMNERGLCLLEMDDITQARDKYWWDLWEEQDKPMIKDAVAKALAKEKVHFQASGITLKGNNKWWDVIVLPLKINKGSQQIEKLLTVSRDITDYKIANLKIVESEHRYRAMIYSSPFLIAILKGKDYIIEIANDAIIQCWDKGKDVIGKSMLAILPEIVEQGFEEILKNVYATGETFEANEMPITLEKNGVPELRYFTFVYQALKTLDGVIEGISIIANEVTPQAIINKKIKASEEQFRLLVQQAPVAICVLMGKDYVIETINEPMVQMWNRSMADVLNKPAFEVLKELKDQGFKQLLDDVYNTGIPFVAEELPINLQRNGRLENVFVKFVYEPLRGVDGVINGVMALAIEITEQVVARKKIEGSEQHFRKLADMMPSKISNAHPNGNAIYFNKKWLDYTGKSFEEIKDLGYYNIMHPDEMEEFATKFSHANETKTQLKMEMRFLNKHGEYKWHLNNASPIIDEAGEISMWVGSTTEIHEQVTQKELLEAAVKERTIELEILNKELVYQNAEKEKRSEELGIANVELAYQNDEKEKRSAELGIANIELAFQIEEKEKRAVELNNLNKELHSFTYVASHDLQEPLRKIKLFAERISDSEGERLSEDGKDYFRRINKSINRMQQLIEDLLAFSRTSTADRTLVSIDLKDIVEEVKEELKDTIEEKDVIVEYGEMCQANIIEFQFRQLIFNLISNAVKFSKKCIAPRIFISSQNIKGDGAANENLLPEKSYCHIQVKDNGIGFEQEHSRRIFEVFQRLHGKEEYKGTGIGLAIVKKIVENHDGFISAKGKVGQGAEFNIYLPIK